MSSAGSQSIGKVLAEIIKSFQNHGLPHSKQQAEDLLCELLNYSRVELYLNRNHLLSIEQQQKAQFWLLCRLKGEPLAYLSGKVEFYNCLIEVNRSVLIPRPETEVLVDKIVFCLKKQDLQGKVLWDVCCGSGCIGIALKKAFPLLSVYISDYSEQAIELAARNAVANQVDVECLQGDLLDPFRGSKTNYFVCNPPYISEGEYVVLDKEVKEYEPYLALVGGKKGVEMYERLAQELPSYLYSQGQAWFEIGYQQGNVIEKIFQDPCWKKKSVENDWAGHNRFFFLEIE